MNYCPYCAEPLSKLTDVCPHCNKAISADVLQALYEDDQSSRESKAAKRKIWFKEHALYIIPGLTLIAGLIAGMLLAYGYAQIEFAGEREDLQNRISQLEATIAQKDASIANADEDFQKSLANRNKIITILQEELDIMSRVMNFTVRLARNSTITPNPPDEADFYSRNVRYLEGQFNQQQEQLQEAGYENIQTYNLITVPQMVSE